MSKSIGNIAHAERRLGGGRQHQGFSKFPTHLHLQVLFVTGIDEVEPTSYRLFIEILRETKFHIDEK